MAFISHELKCVFIHIPKTGGTAVTEALCRMHGEKPLRGPAHLKNNGIGNDIPVKFRPNGVNTHDPWFEIVRKCPEVEGYTKFAVVRNPWARIYSFFRHKLRRRDRDLPLKGNTRVMPFASILRISNVLLLQPQIWWLDGCWQDVTVLPQENLQEHFDILGAALDWPAVQLAALNTDPQKADYTQAYDEWGRRLIQAYYQTEIDEFEYEFGE